MHVCLPTPLTMGNLYPTVPHISMFVYLYLPIDNRQPRINVYSPSFITWTGHLPAKIIGWHENPRNSIYPCNLICRTSSITATTSSVLKYPRLTKYPHPFISTLLHYLNCSFTGEIHRLAWKLTKLHLPMWPHMLDLFNYPRQHLLFLNTHD